jgi:hypothetical protein
MMSNYSNLNRISDFIVNNRALVTIKSIISDSTKTARKILLVLADSVTGDIVLNDELFNTRSITVINIQNSQEINWLMQPCDFKIQSITNLYYNCKRSIG